MWRTDIGVAEGGAAMASDDAAQSVRVVESVKDYRAWRDETLRQGKTVGFVPTMGALHEGHLSLVDASLAENAYTVVSIFVNPAQFAPHEDLSSYPRTLEGDLALLAQREVAANATGSVVVLLPQVKDIYPHGFTQEVSQQIGAFVKVEGLSHQMEGTTRPTFFRGVATVVTKLFSVVMVRPATYPARPRLLWPKRYSAGRGFAPSRRRFAVPLPARQRKRPGSSYRARREGLCGAEQSQCVLGHQRT